jgi:hypothetical protein
MLEEYKNKAIQTNIKNYGCNHPMQNAEYCDKHIYKNFKMKEYKFPCNNIIYIQGYEHFLLDLLVKLDFTYNDIKVKRNEVPEIWYEYENRKHKYYCDIYIEKINTIYEVKSIFTYKLGYKTLQLKKEACEKAGYLFE